MTERSAQDIGMCLFAQQVSRTIDLLQQHERHWLWGLGQDGEVLVLIVGQQTFLAYDQRAQTIDLIVDRDFLATSNDPALKEIPIVREFKSNPSHVRVRIPVDASTTLLDRLSAGYEKALPLEESWFRINQRWKWHQDHLRSLLDAYLETPLPDPGYIDQWRALEDTQKIPASPDPVAARQMALTILQAHELGPSSWAVIASNGQVLVNVGQQTVGGSNKAGKFDWVLSRANLDSSLMTTLEASQAKTPPGYEDLIFPRLALDNLFVTFEDLSESHYAALVRLTNPYKKATNWYQHNQNLKYMLEEVSGVELPDPGYLDELPSPGIAVEEETSSPVGEMRQALESQGLTYANHQIAAFYTGLQTKGFVVLSGISGTGKSKIATSFVDLLPQKQTQATPESAIAGMESIVVRPYMLKTHGFVLPAKMYPFLPPLESGTAYQLPITIDGYRGTGRFWFRVHQGRDQYLLYFHQTLYEKIDRWVEGNTIHLRPILSPDADRVIEFEVFTELPEPVADQSMVTIDHHLFLSVRPDWRDSTSLLGYYNPLTSAYEWTDFLRFILRAAENYKGPAEDRIAWFVILDEMNLAHVEYYFADLLSVIESGRDADGWTSEPLRFTYPETLEDDDVPPREVKLPPNLYLIGTVNMDETTHAFSPKVLDRAFTIELTDVDFTTYPPAITTETGGGPSEDEKWQFLKQFSRDGKFAVIDKTEIAGFIEEYPEVRDWLQALNSRLAIYRLHFGYRVFDEIVQYLANNERDAVVDLVDAFDLAVLMKVLPKFTGSRARLEDPLGTIWTWATDPLATGVPTTEPGSGPRFPRVAERVQLMQAALERDGFVSFG